MNSSGFERSPCSTAISAPGARFGPTGLHAGDIQQLIDERGKYLIHADGVKLKQVFLNLIDNSIKYTKEGFVEVSLSENPNEETVTFSVHDSGVGISEETKAKLFTKFSRGEAGALNTGGSGLGLYLAEEIVKAHKGHITIDSEGLGKGSTFSVVLPTHG